MSSDSFFDLSMIALVSDNNVSGVAVKTGGAWGGFLNVAMDEVETGLKGAWDDAPEVLRGRI